MPTYGYRCPSCSTEFEMWQRMSDEPGAACPSCGAAARRVFYPAGIVFKGAGFYATDSRAKSSATNSSSTPPTSTSAASSDGGKSDGAATPSGGSSSNTGTGSTPAASPTT